MTAELFRAALCPRIVRNALQVSAVVGTLLNVINQGEALWTGSGISWVHIGMNYLVPYCVASYSAARNQISASSAATPGSQRETG